MSKPTRVEDLRRRYLQRLYDRSGGDINFGVNEDELLADLGIEEEGNKLFSYLSAKGLVEGHTFGHIAITDRGIDEIERIMTETYRSKERRVLQKLYDERDRRYTNPHQPDELARELNLDLREAQDIVVELE